MVQIFLFGTVEVVDRQGQPVSLVTRKVGQLLAYLWLHRDQPQVRARLAGLLWPDSSDERARQSLRKALFDLRKAVEMPADLPPLLIVSRTTVQFNPKAVYWADVTQFEQTIEQAKTQSDELRIQTLRDAVSLYRGEFLEGCYEDWCLHEQDYQREAHLKTLQQLITIHIERKEFQQAIPFAKTVLIDNPLQEEVHRQLIYLHFAMGDRNAAIAQYRECERILEAELQAEPLPETKALYEEINARANTTVIEDIVRSKRTLIEKYPELGARFVGRHQELTKLMADWEACRNQERKAVFLGGVAGAGKTRLSQEIASFINNEGGLALNGRCYEFEGALPYQPWIEVLRQACASLPKSSLSQVPSIWLGELMKLAPELLEQFPTIKPLTPLLFPEQERSRLFEGMGQFFTKIAQQTPLMIVIDDLQWADESTLSFIHYLIHRSGPVSLFFLGVYRSEEVLDEHPLLSLLEQSLKEGKLEKLDLPELSKDEVSELIHSMLQVETQQPLIVDQLFQSAKGNPFFVTEQLKSLIESGAVSLDEAGVWQLPDEATLTSNFPESIKAVIETRLRRISRQSREVLNLAAVRARPLDLDFLAQLYNRPGPHFIDNLEELLRTHFFVEQNHAYTFEHDITQQVIYQGLSPERQRQLHQKVARTLEETYQQLDDRKATGFVGEMSQHFYAAHEPIKALKYSLLAAQQAWAMNYAKSEALLFYDRALDLAMELQDEKSQMLAYKGIGEVRSFTQGDEETIDFNLKALALCEDTHEKAQIYCALSRTSHHNRDFKQALAYCEQALEQLGPQDTSSTTINTCYHASSFLNWMGRHEEAIEYGKRALRLLEKEPDENLKSLVLSELGHGYSKQGDRKASTECLQQSAQLAERIGDQNAKVHAYFQLGIDHFNAGEVETAIEFCHKTLEVLKVMGNRPGDEAIMYNWLARALMRLENFTKALQFAEKQLESSLAAKDLGMTVLSHGTLGCLYDVMDNPQQSEESFAQALELQPESSTLHQAIIKSYLYSSRVNSAIEWLEKSINFLEERHIKALRSITYTPSFDAFRNDERVQKILFGKHE